MPRLAPLLKQLNDREQAPFLQQKIDESKALLEQEKADLRQFIQTTVQSHLRPLQEALSKLPREAQGLIQGDGGVTRKNLSALLQKAVQGLGEDLSGVVASLTESVVMMEQRLIDAIGSIPKPEKPKTVDLSALHQKLEDIHKVVSDLPQEFELDMPEQPSRPMPTFRVERDQNGYIIRVVPE